MNQEVNVLAMIKGEERYVFLYDDKNRIETLRMLGRYAADPQLSFSWYDAAVLSQRVRQTSNVPAPHGPKKGSRFELPLPTDDDR